MLLKDANSCYGALWLCQQEEKTLTRGDNQRGALRIDEDDHFMSFVLNISARYILAYRSDSYIGCNCFFFKFLYHTTKVIGAKSAALSFL